MRFVKAETNGNDFVIIDEEFLPDEERIRGICDRRRGIGCDQLILVCKVCHDRYALRFFNSDGSEAEICGNGVCAFGVCLGQDVRLQIETNCGLRRMCVVGNDATFFAPLPQIMEKADDFQIIFVGNKHLITDMKMLDLQASLVAAHSDCNIHFIERIAGGAVRMKSFERGSGWTMACGSGAMAAAFACDATEIVHDGGVSRVEHLNEEMSLTTQPHLVFAGEI